MVDRVLDRKQPARAGADFGVSERTVRMWLGRWGEGGEPALTVRSSAPLANEGLGYSPQA